MAEIRTSDADFLQSRLHLNSWNMPDIVTRGYKWLILVGKFKPGISGNAKGRPAGVRYSVQYAPISSN
jgi:hypothetical protein